MNSFILVGPRASIEPRPRPCALPFPSVRKAASEQERNLRNLSAAHLGADMREDSAMQSNFVTDSTHMCEQR